MSNEISEKIGEDKVFYSPNDKSIVRKEIVEKINFPLLIIGTPNVKENQINLCLSEKADKLKLSFKENFSLIGDMDMLLKLDFHKNNANIQYYQDPSQIHNLLH